MNEPAAGVRPRFHPLRVKAVVDETDDARSIVFDVPEHLRDVFTYRPGQFVTVRLVVDDEPVLRSYSMSSAPSVDPDLQVTIKRVPGGVVSNWLNDDVSAGDTLEVSTPGGGFVLDDGAGDIVAFAAGSGITPIFSIVKAALRASDRRVRILFANRERRAAIFGAAIDELAEQHPARLSVTHHEDVADGFVGDSDVAAFVAGATDATYYVCGPDPFMRIVETALLEHGVDPGAIHIERFTPGEGSGTALAEPAPDDPAHGITVSITLGGKTATVDQRGRTTILESARWGGLKAPSSCEAGHCATCMARVVEGSVEMARNEVLTPEEVAEGWVLTCQSVPVSPVVRVVYE